VASSRPHIKWEKEKSSYLSHLMGGARGHRLLGSVLEKKEEEGKIKKEKKKKTTG